MCRGLMIGKWLSWYGMRAKIPKCTTLAIQSSISRKVDSKLLLHGQPIPFANQAIKVLGMRSEVSCNQSTSKVVEIGSRGMEHMDGFMQLRQELSISKHDITKLLVLVTKTSISESFTIRCKKCVIIICLCLCTDLHIEDGSINVQCTLTRLTYCNFSPPSLCTMYGTQRQLQ